MLSSEAAARSGRARFEDRPVGAARAECPCPVRVHIHLDANRDGVVDDEWALNRSWTAGPDGRGAVVLCNCDDENGTPGQDGKEEDHVNLDIDGADDNSDIAPFHLRKHPRDERVPPGWKVVVEVLHGHHTLFRIFNNERAAGTALLGPDKGPSFEITDLSQNEWKYGMETNQYPGRIKNPVLEPRCVEPCGTTWSGEIVVQLRLIDRHGAVRDTEEALIRCAPWVMFNHMDPTEELYVVKMLYNGPFIADLDAATGMPARQFQENNDQWMQDVMDLGFSTLPQRTAQPDMHLPVPIRTANLRRLNWRGSQLDELIRKNLLGKRYGYYEPVAPGGNGSSLDSFGNLECVPPFRHPTEEKDYLFGRIIYGSGGEHQSDMAAEVQEFLGAQGVQAPFTVNTGWLNVGHIDEVLSFVPTPDGRFGFKAVLACPDLARQICARLPPSTPLFRGIRALDELPDGGREWTGWTVGETILGWDALLEKNDYAQDMIDLIKQALRENVGLPEEDFIDIPGLFWEVDGRCLALTPGSVNMLVVTRGPQTREGARSVTLVIPKPFGPTLAPPGAIGSAAPPCEFEKEIAEKLRLTGVTCRFVDNFVDYHLARGQIHCGTNSKRKGAIDRFWWQQRP
jgi:hypothetical protein